LNFGKTDNCTFTGNIAKTGSAINIYSDSERITIQNSIFLNNRANAEPNCPILITEMENNITITFIGNNNLLNAINSNVNITVLNVTYWGANGTINTGDSPFIPVRSQNEAGQKIIVKVIDNDHIILNKTYLTDINGSINIETEITGDYIIIVLHEEDSYYTRSERIRTNIVYHIKVKPMTIKGKTANITAESNITQELIQGIMQFILPNGERINATYDGNGIWWALYTFDDFGEYNIGASYMGMNSATVANATIRINPVPVESSITASDKGYVINYDGTYSAILKDAQGNAISGEKLTFILNGKNIGYGITNAKGVTSIRLTAKILKTAKSGKKTLVVKFLGTDNYISTAKTVKITVNKEKTKITAKKKTFKKTDKKKKYTITLKNSKGKAVKKVKVTIKIGKKTFKAKTNAKGKATFKIKKLTKKGTYKAKVTFKGNAYYNKSTKTIKIKIK